MDRGTVRAAADDPHRARLRAQGPRRPRADGHNQVMDLTRTTPRSHRRPLPGIRRAEARTRPQDTWKGKRMNIVDFLLARIAEDEAAAHAASPGGWQYSTVESVAGGTLYDES